MHILKRRYLIIGTVILYLLTGIVFLQRYKESQTSELYKIIYVTTRGMQFRSILGSLALFALGITFLYIVRKEMEEIWIILFAYPAGVCLWCLGGILVLIMGLPFNLLFVIGIIAGILCILFIIEKPQMNLNMIKNAGWGLFVFSGVASIASTGLFFTFAPHDYYYHINELGKALVITGGLYKEFKTYLTAIGIAPTVLGSYAYMIGVDNLYTFHHCFSLSFLGIFSYGIYSHSKRHALLQSAAMILILRLLPPIVELQGWIISNAHSMFLLFIICYILFRYKEYDYIPHDYSCLLIVLIASFTFLRSDAGITLCCLYVCIACTALKNSEIVRKYILPSVGLLSIYYIRIFWIIGEADGGMFLSWKTTGAILLLYLCVVLYYLFFRNKQWFSSIQKHYIRIVVLGLGGINIFLAIFIKEYYFSNLKIILHNLFTPDVFWGTTGFLIILFSVKTLLERTTNIWLFMVFITAIVVIDVGALRGYLTGVAREGFGDSMNRLLSSLLPIFIFGAHLSFQEKEEGFLSAANDGIQ